MPPLTFPPLHRALGLSVGLTYASLGLHAIFQPTLCARNLGLLPPQNVAGPRSVAASQSLSTAMLFLGARDLSIAAAITWFYIRDQPAEMGVVILSGTILTVVDTVAVWRARRDWFAGALGAGAAIWFGIGVGLLRAE